jgi:hypothetical protein
MQHRPLSDPIGRPKNYLHRSIRFDLVKYHIISIQPNIIAQQSAAAPSKIWFLSFRHNPYSQEPNRLAKLVGG